jgi:hypothetical protein
MSVISFDGKYTIEKVKALSLADRQLFGGLEKAIGEKGNLRLTDVSPQENGLILSIEFSPLDYENFRSAKFKALSVVRQENSLKIATPNGGFISFLITSPRTP